MLDHDMEYHRLNTMESSPEYQAAWGEFCQINEEIEINSTALFELSERADDVVATSIAAKSRADEVRAELDQMWQMRSTQKSAPPANSNRFFVWAHLAAAKKSVYPFWEPKNAANPTPAESLDIEKIARFLADLAHEKQAKLARNEVLSGIKSHGENLQKLKDRLKLIHAKMQQILPVTPDQYRRVQIEKPWLENEAAAHDAYVTGDIAEMRRCESLRPALKADARAAETSFAVTLKAWHAKPGRTRNWAAAALGVPIANYNRYCDGGGCQQEATLRKLMQMIDAAESAEATACAKIAALPARS